MRDLSLVLRPKFESAAADKAIAKQATALRSTQTTMERLNKEAHKGLKEQETLWKRLEGAVSGFGRTAVRGMDSALGGVNKLQKGMEGAVKHALSLRNIIMGSAIGAGAIGLGRHILSAGAGDVRSERALTREFGPGLLSKNIRMHAADIAKYAGIEDNDALTGLLPIARAIRETKIGDKTGGKTIRTQKQLDAVQNAQFKAAAARFKVMATLHKDMSPDQIGFMLSEAGQGEEGLRALAGGLHLGKGTMADIKRDAHKGKMGIDDVIGEMFKRSGHTEKAAGIERQSFEAQISALEATVNTSMGQIGSKAIDKLNEKLGNGATLAERFQKFLTPERIDKFADALAGVVDKLATMAEKLPAAFSWLEEHKTTILTIAGAYAGLRVVGAARDTLGKALGGTGGAVGKLLGKVDEGQKVFVTNWPGSMGGSGDGIGGLAGAAGKIGMMGLLGKASMVAGVGLAAYELTTLADEASGGRISGGTAKAAGWITGQDKRMERRESAGVGENASRLNAKTSDRNERIRLLMERGIDKGDAINAADHPDNEAGAATIKRAGLNMDLSGAVFNIGATIGQNVPQIVKSLMPDFQEQLTRLLAGAVPAK